MKIRTIILLVLINMLFIPVRAQFVMQNTLYRDRASLNGKWHVIVDPYETGYYDYRYQPRDQSEHPGVDAIFMDARPKNKWDKVEYDFDLSPTLNVPGDWNSQDEKLLYYEGTIWYKKSFDYTKKDPGNRVFIQFGAINYRADVYLNGHKLGIHEGGFTPFCFEVTSWLKPAGNFLVVKADNKRSKDAVPTLNTDWWNYGGITRDVNIIETGPVFITDYLIRLKNDDKNLITGYVQLDGTDREEKEVMLSIPGLKVVKTLHTDQTGKADFAFRVKDIEYWSPEHPKRYDVVLTFNGSDLKDNIGFRTIAVKGTEILLNGQPVFLRGISIHEENPMGGRRAYSTEDAALLLNWAKELGCNYVRLAHYPHNEHMIRMADEMGILVWEENPVYWTISFDNPETYRLAEAQLKEEISRDKNRAAVIIWSMANETPTTPARLDFLIRLSKTAREADPSRLISAALERGSVHNDPNTFTIDDPFSAYVDVVSFNEYVGWYDGLPAKCKDINWNIDINKPVIVSEFGGGALYGYHADSLTRWSEEYQEDLYIRNINMLRRIPQLRGMSPWILADFRSPKRLLPVIQDGWNRKGLISQRGFRKKAFFVLQDFYREMKQEWNKQKQ